MSARNKYANAHLVNALVMQEPVYPVDTHISKEQETSNAQEYPRPA